MSALRVDQLLAILEERLGFACVAWQRDRLADLLARREIDVLPCDDSSSDLGTLSHDDLQAILDLVTVGETYFFREPAHFAALFDTVLFDRLQGPRDGRPLRILSAGCSSGEEVYSIAIALREHEQILAAMPVELTGIDVHAAALEKARRARYSAWALRMTSDVVRRRYFEAKGDEFQLLLETRRMVSFEERNLLEFDPGFFRPGSFDVIFCRNVLIYFSESAARTAVARLSEALSPGGFLFLGHSESIRGLSEDFTQCHSHDTFFYRKKSPSAPALRSNMLPNFSTAPAIAEPWFEVIKNSTQRVAQLTTDHKRKSPIPAPIPAKSSQTSEDVWSVLWPILEAISTEQFDVALQRLDGLANAPAESAATLARAAIYCGQGRFIESQRACQRLVDAGTYLAESHYLQALCHEHLGDAERAKRMYQDAVQIAPHFGMAHLRLGALLRRLGRRVEARTALKKAEEFVLHASREHILLFGGGFQRAALLSLCRAELSALGAET